MTVERGVLAGCVLCAALLSGCVFQTEQTDVVLSPEGPFPSPAAAVARARELRRSGVVRGRAVTVSVRPGRYALSEPLVLKPEDSGLHFTGCGPETCVFDGGVRLPSFRQADGGVWETDASAVPSFDQLWVNGRRAQRARSPNRFYFYMREQDFERPKTDFFADPADIAPLSGLSPEERGDVVVGVWQSWDMGFGRIAGLDAATGHVSLRKPVGRNLFHWSKTCPRYTLENFRAALDAPGEWFLDRRTGKLLYVPREGEKIGTSVAVAPVSSCLVRFAGDRTKGSLVRDIAFRGIGFEHAAFRIGPDGLHAAQSASNISEAALGGDGAEEIDFANCRVAHVGAHGLWLRNGCRHVTVRHCLVEDVGAGGVYFGDTRADMACRDNNAAFLEIRDSIIRHGGRQVNSGIGVWIGKAHDCSVVHNDIYDFLYTGVSSGWTWGYAETVTRNIKVNHNRIHHIGQGVLSDMGAFYSLGDHTGSEVCNNWVWEVNGYADNGSPAWGLYTDEGSKGVVFRNNLVENCRDGAIHQHYGTENVHSNNIYTTFRRSGVWRSRNEDHLTLRIRNNVFWWTDPGAETYRGGGDYESLKDMEIDGNVYWCSGGEVSKTAFKGRDWETWRKAGKDVHGVVADPLFVDPVHGDWSLRPESPVLKTGFRPFDWRDSGVLPDDRAWVAKAAERTWDDFVDAPAAPRYRLERAKLDCERFAVGPLRDGMGAMLPFNASMGLPGGLSFTDQDAAGGRRALVFTDSPKNSCRYCPHLYLNCCIEDGMALVRFAFKPVKGDGMEMELRDYSNGGADFVTGVALGYRGGCLYAGGRRLLPVPLGTWAEVELLVPLKGSRAGRWTATAAVRGGERRTESFDAFRNDRFAALTWVGFMSYGDDTGVWQLDDFALTALASPLEAKWIAAEIPKPEHTRPVGRAAPVFRRRFTLPAATHLKMRVSGMGLFTCTVDGRNVLDSVLDPAPTQYDRRWYWRTADLGELPPGEHLVSIEVGNGFYYESGVGWNFSSAPWRDVPKAFCEMSDASGKVVLATDDTWCYAYGPVTSNGWRHGDVYDARRMLPDGVCEGDGWKRAIVVAGPGGIGEEQPHAPCRETAVLPMREVAPSMWEAPYDLAGVPRIRVRGEAGAKIVLSCGELKPHERRTLHETKRPVLPQYGKMQRDEYVLSGKGVETWQPRYTYHGFRYVRAEITGRAELLSVDAVETRTDFRRLGSVRTSDAVLQAVYDAAVRSCLANFVGIPTDCPHREKNGWTSEARLMCETFLYGVDAGAAYGAFVDMMADAQRPSGQLPGIVPCAGWGYNWGSGPAWDAALCLVPRSILAFTGDDAVAKRNYQAMKRYCDFCRTMLDGDGIASFGLGDWVSAGPGKTQPELVTHAFYCASLAATADFAARFGRKDDVDDLVGRIAEAKAAFCRKFYRGNGVMSSEPTTAAALALVFDLVPKGERKACEAALRARVRANAHKVDYGTIGSGCVLRALLDAGYADDAYWMMTQPSCPGYANIAALQTTFPEVWNPERSGSEDHGAFADVAACLYRYFGGIRPDGTLCGLDVRPLFPKDVKDFEASWRGYVSFWRRTAEGVAYVLEVPVGRTARLTLPGGKTETLGPGRHERRWM